MLSSCKKGENNAIEPKNEQNLLIGDRSYPLNYGVFYHSDGYNEEKSNMEMELFLTAEYYLNESCSVCHVLYIRLFSFKENVPSGEFKISNSVGGVPGANAHFLKKRRDFVVFSIKEGTIKLSGVFPNYTVELDGSYKDGTKVVANFTGAFADLKKLAADVNTRSSRKVKEIRSVRKK